MPQSDASSSDGTVVTAVLDGDTEQFATIVGRYERALRCLAANRLGSLAKAEDVVQETFFCAFKSLHTYDSRYSFRTWLWTILLNQCRRSIRSSGRRRDFTWTDCHAHQSNENKLAEIQSAETTPSRHMELKERSAQLDLCLAQLTQTQADALRLRFFASLKFQEIADVMQCSLGTAKNRVRAGLIRMSEIVCRDGHLAAETMPPQPRGEQ